jgi:ssRNA-specific RNase YbeY (16S rRNA maturation enzyme)
MKYVQKWCRDHNVAIEDRLPVLYAHGICHLLGYDHQSGEDYAQVGQPFPPNAIVLMLIEF